jgi:hypothetical protein
MVNEEIVYHVDASLLTSTVPLRRVSLLCPLQDVLLRLLAFLVSFSPVEFSVNIDGFFPSVR